MPNTYHMMRGFTGFNAWINPALLPANLLQKADNVWIVQGVVQTRPALEGMFDTPLTHPLRCPYYYVHTDGTLYLLFVSGGRLYKSVAGSSTYTEILKDGTDHFTLISVNVRMQTLNGYVYIVDGLGELIRTDLLTGSVVTGMDSPVQPPVAVLTNTVIDATTATTGWTPDNPATAQSNLIINGDFTETIGGETLALYPTQYPPPSTYAGWRFTGPDVDFYTGGDVPAGFGGNTWVQLDDAGEALETDDPLVNPAVTGDAARYCRQLYVRANYCTDDATRTSGFTCTVTAYSDLAATIVVAVQSVDFVVLIDGQVPGQYWDHMFTFPSNLGIQIRSYKVKFAGAPFNTRHYGPFLTELKASVMNDPLLLLEDPNGTSIDVNLSEATAASWGKVGGLYLVRDYTTPQDWIGNNIISVQLAGVTDFVSRGLQLTLGFGVEVAGVITYYYSNIMSIVGDVNAGYYASVDISTLTSTVRASFRYLAIVFTSDIAPTTATPLVMAYGPISAGGNLAVGWADYAWSFVEEDQITPTDVIDSNPSPPSNLLTMTLQKAQANITKPTDCPINTITNHYVVFRAGGTYGDGLSRLVATVPIDADVAYGADPLNPYYSWNHTTGVLLDNTPDSWLLQAETMVTGRDKPPVGAQCISVWQGRLWLAVGNTVYGSWLVTSGSALYFSSINLTGSATAPIEGAMFPVGSTNDRIQNFIELGTPVEAGNQFGGSLAVLKGHSVAMIQGDTANTFNVITQEYDPGIGLVAPMALCRMSVFGIAFLGQDRVHEFPIFYRRHLLDTNLSLPISPMLYPRGENGGEVIAPEALAKSWMCKHDNRLYLGAPVAGELENSVIYVYDMNDADSATHGWTRYLNMPVTGAVSVPPSGTQGFFMYLGGLDGQMYRLNPQQYQDTATPDATPTNISVDVVGAAVGMGPRTSMPDYFSKTRTTSVYTDIRAIGDVTTTVTAQRQDAQGDISGTGTFTYTGRRQNRDTVTPNLDGYLLYPSVTASLPGQFQLWAIGLVTNETEQKQ